MSVLIGIIMALKNDQYCVRRDYITWLVQANAAPVIIPAEGDSRDRELFFAGLVDGILIPGGGDIHPSVYGKEIEVPESLLILESREKSACEIRMIHLLCERQKPVLGICYGMQIINTAFGGTLRQDISLQTGSPIDHRSGHHTITAAQSFFLGKGSAVVNSTHHQSIDRIGDGLSVLFQSDDGIVEAVSHSGYHFVAGVQWHPEKEPVENLSQKILRSFLRAAEESRGRSLP